MGSPVSSGESRLAAVAPLVVAIAVGWWCVPVPPSAVDAAADASAFSAQRAFVHVEHIARAPHPVGSAEHRRVGDYLVAQLRGLGLATREQEGFALRRLSWSSPTLTALVGGHIRNIIARRPGSDSASGVVRLMAHYDSVPGSPAAADDGLGVAALLETARALMHGPRSRNAIEIVFTDGEETPLLGSHAFFAELPTASQGSVVLNFEARGNRGPVLMFETSGASQRLVELLRETDAPPHAYSFSQAVYARLPNTTDFAEARVAGHPGMNFANVQGLGRYHASSDAPASLDRDTLQHSGAYALGLARRLGQAPLDALGDAGGAVYFPVLGHLFILSYGWMYALAVVAVAGWLGVLRLGRRRGLWTLRSVAIGAGGALGGVVGACLLGVGLLRAVGLVGRDAVLLTAGSSRVRLLLLAALGLGVIALFAEASRRASRRHAAQAIALGALGLAMLLAAASAVLAPAASYLFVIPALCALASIGVRAFAPAMHRAPRLLVHCLLAAVSAAILAPAVFLLFATFELEMPGLLGGMLALVLTLYASSILGAMRALPGWSTAGLAGAGLAAVAISLALPMFTRSDPQPASLRYLVNLDGPEAWWATPDVHPSGEAAHVLEAPRRARVPELLPLAWSPPHWVAKAPVTPVTGPVVELVAEAPATAPGRSLRLQLRPRGSRTVQLLIQGEERASRVKLGQTEIDVTEGSRIEITLHGLSDAGLPVELDTRKPGPIVLRLVGESDAIPCGLPGLPACADLPLDRQTWVGQSYRL